MLPLFAIIRSSSCPTATSFKIHPSIENKKVTTRPAQSKKGGWERRPEDRDRWKRRWRREEDAHDVVKRRPLGGFWRQSHVISK